MPLSTQGNGWMWPAPVSARNKNAMSNLVTSKEKEYAEPLKTCAIIQVMLQYLDLLC